MKKQLIFKMLLITIFVLTICFFASTDVEAASAAISVNSTVEVNKPITISVSGTGVQWNLKLSVDGTVIAQSSELENYESNKTISFSGTYTPTTQGNKTVKLEGSVTEFSDGSTITSFGTKTINVTPAVTPTPTPTQNATTPETTPTVTPAQVAKSSNANLKNLGITPNDFSGFTASKTEYYVTVPYEVEKVNVYAKKAESSQTIFGTGDKTLEIGATTRCTVTVTAEDGTTQKTYNIYVTRKSEPTEIVPNVVEEPEELLKLSTLEVKNATITPEFNPDVYEYEVNLEDNTIEKLDILATANIENASIDVTGNENFMEGENTVTIVLKSEDGTKAATYTITVTKGAVAIEETPEPIQEEQEEQKQEEKKNVFAFLKTGNTGMIIALVIAVIVLLASIITVVVILIKNRKDSEAEMMSFTPNSEYNVFEEKAEEKDKEDVENKKIKREKRRGKHF